MDEKKITLTRDELIDAESEAIALLAIKNPSTMLIYDVLCDAMGALVAVLFRPAKKQEPTMEEKRELLKKHFGAVDLSDKAVNVLYEDYIKEE